MLNPLTIAEIMPSQHQSSDLTIKDSYSKAEATFHSRDNTFAITTLGPIQIRKIVRGPYVTKFVKQAF